MSASSPVAELETLDTPTCFELMASVPVGRIVFTEAALPAIQPVNFVLRVRQIVIRTGSGSKLAAALRSAVVAFETDEYDAADMTGWSVVAIGRAEAVEDDVERRQLDAVGLESWAPGTRHYIRITPEIVRGRRIVRRATSS